MTIAPTTTDARELTDELDDFHRITGEDIARHERELDGERAARDVVDELDRVPPVPEHGTAANPQHGITASDRRGARPFSIVALRIAVERATELINDAELRERVTGRSCGLPIALDVATLRELARAAHRDLARFSPSTEPRE